MERVSVQSSPHLSDSIRAVRAVFFDLDGTLLDAYRSHYRVYTHVFQALGYKLDEAAYLRAYSPNWYQLYERLRVPRDRWPEADRLWLSYYAKEEPQCQPGADDVLTAVQASGRLLGLVTAGDRSRVERDLHRMGWDERFQVVVCGGDVPERKPHPAALARALHLADLSPQVALYVGDTAEDVAMGKAAGVYTAAILGGFSGPDLFEVSTPDVRLESLTDLIAILAGHASSGQGTL